MATQRRFEGNTLAEVLARVQQEVGTDAKIASAQKVRSGGALGFFQKERFEVLVDVAERPSVPPAPAESIASSISSSLSKDEDDDSLTPASLLELAQQINREERGNERTVSTESDVFADVLSRMAFQADMQSTPPSAAAPVAHEPVPPHPTIPDRPSFLDASPPHPPAPNDVPAPSSLHHSGPLGPSAPEDAVIASPDVASPAVGFVPAVLPTPAPAPVVATPVAAPAVEAPRTRITDHPLAKLGLPGPYIPMQSDALDLRGDLTEVLAERLPKAPVVRPSRGSIIAVVGSREDALRIAGDLAVEFGRPKEEIVVASQYVKGKPADNVLRTVENAEDAQRSWSRRNRPTVVAIDAYPGSTDTSWAEHILTALEPIATFGVTDGFRKAEDIAAWADSLGGIDCLAVNNIAETVTPAAVLHAGIPVERVDGRKATPEFWALLLTERLSAA